MLEESTNDNICEDGKGSDGARGKVKKHPLVNFFFPCLRVRCHRYDNDPQQTDHEARASQILQRRSDHGIFCDRRYSGFDSSRIYSSIQYSALR